MKLFFLFQIIVLTLIYSSYSSAKHCQLLLSKKVSLFNNEDTFFNNSIHGKIEGSEIANENFIPQSESDWYQLSFGSIKGINVNGMYVRASMILNGKNLIIQGVLNADFVTHRVESIPVGLKYSITTLSGVTVPIPLGSKTLHQLMSIMGMTSEVYFETKFLHQPTLRIRERTYQSGNFSSSWQSIKAIQERTTWSVFQRPEEVDIDLNNQRVGLRDGSKVIEGTLIVELSTDRVESYPVDERFYLLLDNGQKIQMTPNELDGYKIARGY